MVSITRCGNSMQPIAQTAYAQQPSLFEDYDALGAAVNQSNLQHGFTRMPNNILTCPDISPRAKQAYEALLYHARQKDTCFPGHKRLAALMGCSEDTMQRGLKDLRDYLVRVDAETGRLAVDSACPACSQVQDEEPDPRKKPFCRCHVHTCLVIWVRRGLTHTNLYILPPLYTTMKELEAALQSQSGEGVTPAQDGASCMSSSSAVSGARSVRHQEPAICGTNQTKKNNTYGNEGSRISRPEGGAAAIGNAEMHPYPHYDDNSSQYASMHEMPADEREQTHISPSFSHRNRTSNPTEKGTGRENAKAVNGAITDFRLKQRHRDIRAAAATGIDITHLDELNRQNRRASASQPRQARELPDWLEQAMIDFSRDLNDSNRMQSNITNLDRVYVYCRDNHGLTDEQFYYLIEDMKKRARRAAMMDVTPEGKPARAKYFFACLYNEVGYRPAKR